MQKVVGSNPISRSLGQALQSLKRGLCGLWAAVLRGDFRAGAHGCPNLRARIGHEGLLDRGIGDLGSRVVGLYRRVPGLYDRWMATPGWSGYPARWSAVSSNAPPSTGCWTLRRAARAARSCCAVRRGSVRRPCWRGPPSAPPATPSSAPRVSRQSRISRSPACTASCVRSWRSWATCPRLKRTHWRAHLGWLRHSARTACWSRLRR